jgi:hypothetical protein
VVTLVSTAPANLPTTLTRVWAVTSLSKCPDDNQVLGEARDVAVEQFALKDIPETSRVPARICRGADLMNMGFTGVEFGSWTNSPDDVLRLLVAALKTSGEAMHEPILEVVDVMNGFL